MSALTNPEAVTLDLDVSAELSNFDDRVRALIAKHDAVLVYFQRFGPGGGNPNYGVVAPDRPTAAALVAELYDDPDHDWQVNVRETGAFDFHRRAATLPGSNVVGGGEPKYPAYGPGSITDAATYANLEPTA